MNHNRACTLKDFAQPALRDVLRDVFADEAARHGEGFPAGREWRKQWEVAMAVRALEAGGVLHAEAHLLGVGAGIEVTSYYLARRAGRVIATDLYVQPGAWQADAPPAMLHAPERFAPFDYPRERLRALPMDGRRLAFADESFDGIFSSSSIEHFGGYDDVAESAYEMGRVLRPGGVLTLSTELEIYGPPEWPQWPGLLLFRKPDLLHYIVEASGLEPLDELDLTVSAPTVEGWWPLAAYVGEVGPGEGSRGPRGGWSHYPHVVLWHENRLFTSVHLALRKPARSRHRGWAAPPRGGCTRPDAAALGVNLVGDLVVDSGLGEAARGIARAAAGEGVALSHLPLRYHWWRKLPTLDDELGALPREPLHDTNLLFFGLTQLDVVQPRLARLLGDRPTIGYWMWENPRVPETLVGAMRGVREVWTCSRYVRSLLAPHVPCPIRIVPLPVDPRPTGADARVRHGIPRDRYVFLASLSVASLVDRKNPLGVVEAFRRAFGTAAGEADPHRPLLVLKLQHADLVATSQIAEAARAVGALVIAEDLERGEMDDLLAACDAYVSLHRAEGFGLGMAEAMALGKPVIATAFSGNLDYMRPENGYLVPCHITAPRLADHYPDTYVPWALDLLRITPDVDAAGRFMRTLVDHPEEGRARGARAALDIRRHCAPEVVGRRVHDLLASFRRRHRARPGVAMHDQLERNLADQREELDDLGTRLAQLLEHAPAPPSADLLALANHIGLSVGENAPPAAPPRLGRANVVERLRRVRRHLGMLRHALLKQAEFDRALLRELGRE
jgi:glycosyltransferase involved in cell wall biosynthesis